MSDIAKLREQAAAICGEIGRLEAIERFNEGVKLVGKCFRYRNCYSLPKSEADYWWMYQRVLASTKDGRLVIFTFQTDSYGKHEVEQTHRSARLTLGEPITLKQFQHAWRVMARRLNQAARSANAVKP